MSAAYQLCCTIWLAAISFRPECVSVTTDHLVAERVHAPSQYDAILKITSTCICGSDLHMYTGAFPGVRKGDQLGHEVDGLRASLLVCTQVICQMQLVALHQRHICITCKLTGSGLSRVACIRAHFCMLCGARSKPWQCRAYKSFAPSCLAFSCSVVLELTCRNSERDHYCHHASRDWPRCYAAACLLAALRPDSSSHVHHVVALQFMGIVEDVGDQVKDVKKGDRVVAAFDLGCGGCMCAALLAQLLVLSNVDGSRSS